MLPESLRNTWLLTPSLYYSILKIIIINFYDYLYTTYLLKPNDYEEDIKNALRVVHHFYFIVFYQYGNQYRLSNKNLGTKRTNLIRIDKYIKNSLNRVLI